MPSLQREMAKQRNLRPLRRTLREAEAAIRAIKPCFMMSPLTVAQFCAGGEPDLRPRDLRRGHPAPAGGRRRRDRAREAAGRRGRPEAAAAHQLLLLVDARPVPDADGRRRTYEDAESVLEEFMGAGVPMSRLKWHYRSAHESLITFSNVSFYDADLYTFPSVETASDGHGLSFEYVPDGVLRRQGPEPAEARRVADAVVSSPASN